MATKLTPTRRALLERVAQGTVRLSAAATSRRWYLGAGGPAYALPSTQEWVIKNGLAEQLPGGAVVLTEAGKAALADG